MTHINFLHGLVAMAFAEILSRLYEPKVDENEEQGDEETPDNNENSEKKPE